MVVVLKGLIVHQGKVLIVKRAPDDEVGAGTWEFVGGKLEFGENLEEALERETLEESGLNITIRKILYTSTFKTNPMRQVIFLVYLCEAINTNVILSNEHTDYLWASTDQLRSFLPKGIINDLEKNQVFALEELG